MTTGQQKRYFEFQDDKSTKFWEVTTDGTAVTVRYGKIGTNGQSQTKELADAVAAAKHVSKLVAEKTAKGYVESGQGAESQVASEPVPEATPAAPRKKAASAKKAAGTNPAKDPEASPESLLALLDQSDTTNRLLARHPRASADLLEKLSHSSDKATRQAVTANPATPPEVYLRLGQQFPKEFLANPMLDLLLLERPALLHEQPDTLLVQILRHATCPEDFLIWAAGHESEKVQLAVAMNAKAPEQAMDKLRQSFYTKVRESLPQMQEQLDRDEAEVLFMQEVRKRIADLTAYDAEEAWKHNDIGLAQWPYLSISSRLAVAGLDICQVMTCGKISMEVLKKLSINKDEDFRRLVAKAENTPLTVLNELAKDVEQVIPWLVAGNPSTPLNLLEYIARNEGEYVLRNAAENPFCPANILNELSRDEDRNKRGRVAKNPATPPEIMNTLASDKEEYVRRILAENPCCPPSALEILAHDQSKYVRSIVAKSPRCPASALEALAQDADMSIRLIVSENPASPASVLAALAQDMEETVRWRVAGNPSTPTALLEGLAHKYPSWVGKNPSTPLEMLQALAQDSNEYVRSSVAENPRSPSSVLEALAKDKNDFVRSSVAGNSNSPSNVLGALAEDKKSAVRNEAASNPSTPQAALVILGKSTSSDIRRRLSQNISTPSTILDSLSLDQDEKVKIGVASHPNTSNDTFARLANDPSTSVRLALLMNAYSPTDLVEIILQKMLLGDPRLDPWFVYELHQAKDEVKQAIANRNILHYAGKDPNSGVLANRNLSKLMALCSDRNVDPARIAKVSGSTDWLVRAAIARNSNTPPNILSKLAKDVHPVVSNLSKAASR